MGLMLLAVLCSTVLAGCLRRTMTLTTQPPGALVFLNDEEVGRADITVDFTWYGDYDVVIRKDGFKTLSTHWNVKPPWYEVPPLDFITEVLWPGWVTDARTRDFVLEPATSPTNEELISRALDMRGRALAPTAPGPPRE